jgi:hypothetical protein
MADDLDRVLADLLKKDLFVHEDDRAFVERILDSITTGSKGIFVVLHPMQNDRLEYMLLNTNRAGGIALLAKVLQRLAEVLESS